ncbi:MAG TPA: aminotransferase class IV [Bacteroidales bacterium]|nr:aminotransferase class IV [Bacteroidales bacterium]
MNNSRKSLFGVDKGIDLSNYMLIPEQLDDGKYKCRVIYAENIESVEIIPYLKRQIKSLKLVNGNDITYHHKFLDRQDIERLYEQRGHCDDILIIKNGLLTDTSFCNIALFNGNSWYTPEHPLLMGTKRQKLLDEKKIISKVLQAKELNNYSKICLFNALIEFGELEIPVTAIG